MRARLLAADEQLPPQAAALLELGSAISTSATMTSVGGDLPSLDQQKGRAKEVKKWQRLEALDHGPATTGNGDGNGGADSLKHKIAASVEHTLAAAEVFAKHDVNGDGQLSKLEYISALAELGVRTMFPADEFMKRVDASFRRFDKNADGSVNADEFAQFHNWLVAKKERRRLKKQTKQEKKAKKAHVLLSRNNNGEQDFVGQPTQAGSAGDAIQKARQEAGLDANSGNTSKRVGSAAASTNSGETKPKSATRGSLSKLDTAEEKTRADDEKQVRMRGNMIMLCCSTQRVLFDHHPPS